MKKVIIIAMLFLVCSLFAASELINVTYQDLGSIGKTTMVFKGKPEFNISNNTGSNIVNISCSGTSYASKNKTISKFSKTVSSIVIKQSGNMTTVKINTPIQVSLKKSENVDFNNFILILYTFSTPNPTTLEERISYSKYYYQTGQFDKAISEYEKIEKIDPNYREIYYFWSKIYEKQGLKGQAKAAYEKFRSGGTPVEKPVKADKIVVAPVKDKKEPVKEKKEPVKVTKTPIKPDNKKEATVTKIEKPQAKPIDKLAALKAEASKKSELKEEPEEKPEEPKPDSTEKPDMIASMADTTMLFAKYQDYFLNATDNNQRLLYLALLARSNKNNQEALSYLKLINKESPYFKKSYPLLVDLYEFIGDETNAKYYRSLLSLENPVKTAETNFWKSPLELWLAASIAGGLALFILLGTIVYYTRKIKKSQPAITDKMVKEHEDKIKKKFVEKFDTPEETKTHFKLDIKPQETNFTTSNDDEIDYDSPKLMTENLNSEEEEELAEDESKYFKIMGSSNKAEEQKDEEIDGFGDDEYKRKMILKLHHDGWEVEEIAKELQISQREIEFIIKMS